jgi:alpha-L-fucosidase
MRNSRAFTAALAIALAPLAAPAAAQTTTQVGPAGVPETRAQHDARMKWWRDAKFGMFIHWGVYSVPAGTYHGEQIPGIGEWIMLNAKIPVSEYRGYAKQFTAANYDPDAWAALAHEAGMRYMVITSKHHDGFALFPSAASRWNAVDASAAGRDLIGPLATAARKQGLRFGLYYSQSQDWTNVGGGKLHGYKEGGGWDDAQKGSYDAYLKNVSIPQVREILTRYKPDVLWWDTPTWTTPERAAPLHALLKLQPNIITNNRLGGGFDGDTETPEQYVPATGYPGRDWETCMTMNDTWGYKSYDQNWKSTETLLHTLSDVVSKGGNFLLNVGPMPDGRIPQASIDRLKQIGAWMKVNSDAIYGTTASPFSYLSWGRATRKGQTLYLHVWEWPKDGVLNVPLGNQIRRAYLLAAPGTALTHRTVDGHLRIDVPATAPDSINSVVAVEIVGEPLVPPPLGRGRPATASATRDAAHAATMAFDGDPGTSWSAADADRAGWIQVDLGRPTTVATLGIVEPSKSSDKRGQTLRLQYQDGGTWKTVLEQKTGGRGFTKSFTPVTARLFRLEITDAKDTPGISEMLLMGPE